VIHRVLSTAVPFDFRFGARFGMTMDRGELVWSGPYETNHLPSMSLYSIRKHGLAAQTEFMVFPLLENPNSSAAIAVELNFINYVSGIRRQTFMNTLVCYRVVQNSESPCLRD
jgi:hypothetical protein